MEVAVLKRYVCFHQGHGEKHRASRPPALAALTANEYEPAAVVTYLGRGVSALRPQNIARYSRAHVMRSAVEKNPEAMV